MKTSQARKRPDGTRQAFLDKVDLLQLIQVARQMGHSKVETIKNIYGHLFVQDRTAMLDAMNQAVSRLHVHETTDNGNPGA